MTQLLWYRERSRAERLKLSWRNAFEEQEASSWSSCASYLGIAQEPVATLLSSADDLCDTSCVKHVMRPDIP